MNRGDFMTAKNGLKNVGEVFNEIQLMAQIHSLEARVEELERRIGAAKPKKPLTRIGRFDQYVYDILSDGKIWSTYAMAEDLRLTHPDLPAFKTTNLQGACSRMAKRGFITKVGNCAYRKK